jgi:low affinity Fe/Cu permease
VAEWASNFTSSPTFFGLCFALVAAWAASFATDANQTLENLLGYGMAAVSLLLLARVKNSERRAEHAIQQKLDAIAKSLLHQSGGDAEEARADLERVVGIHDEV